ncbi:DeoR family transcriptional regulator, partial [Streptomyces niveus]|uniref:DeoR family transcriptional regulator n=1 Tax=Streptomyces niveus TaxID=193462 RepID=UPI00114CBBC0
MREGAAERHDRLLSLVRERGTVRVSDLAEWLGVAAVTARRDVEALAARGLLDRAHGAALTDQTEQPVMTFGGTFAHGGGPPGGDEQARWEDSRPCLQT